MLEQSYFYFLFRELVSWRAEELLGEAAADRLARHATRSSPSLRERLAARVRALARRLDQRSARRAEEPPYFRSLGVGSNGRS